MPSADQPHVRDHVRVLLDVIDSRAVANNLLASALWAGLLGVVALGFSWADAVGIVAAGVLAWTALRLGRVVRHRLANLFQGVPALMERPARLSYRDVTTRVNVAVPTSSLSSAASIPVRTSGSHRVIQPALLSSLPGVIRLPNLTGGLGPSSQALAYTSTHWPGMTSDTPLVLRQPSSTGG